MELVTAAQMVMNQTSTRLIAIKSALFVKETKPRVEPTALSAQCTHDPKMTIATAAKTIAIKTLSFYRQESAKNVKKDISQISFSEDNVLLTKETKNAMIDKSS